MLHYYPPTHAFVIDARDLGNGYMESARAASRFNFTIDTNEVKKISRSSERDINMELIFILANEYRRVITRSPVPAVDVIEIEWDGHVAIAGVSIVVADAKSEYTTSQHYPQHFSELVQMITIDHLKSVTEQLESAHVFEFVNALYKVASLNVELQSTLSFPHQPDSKDQPIFRMPYGTDMVIHMKRLTNTFHYIDDNTLMHHMKYLLLKELKRRYIVLDEPICIKLLAACERYCRASKPKAPHPSTFLKGVKND